MDKTSPDHDSIKATEVSPLLRSKDVPKLRGEISSIVLLDKKRWYQTEKLILDLFIDA
ncbi:hypothetical protein AXFE_24700 [Acidithrix ferrooxidans]|uniref:Uncharacterized protein n=1 Tax=Acidithrix ferrooxidans TaxID=1280514 RepID=A0A0D8HFF4_9ACTN|nr:hypothetical protein AXFE_24700 [Acidithrix ferrooxidans]